MDDAARRGIEQDCLRLVAAYAVAADHQDCERFIGVFTRDAQWIRPSGTIEGHDALRDFFLRRPKTVLSRHVSTNALVDVLGPDEARGVSYATVYKQGGHAGGVAAMTLPDSLVEYTDTYVRTEEGWKIKIRRSSTILRRT